MHFMRNLHTAVAAKHAPAVTAAVKTIFAHTDPVAVAEQWDGVADTLESSFPKVANMMSAAKTRRVAVHHIRGLTVTFVLVHVGHLGSGGGRDEFALRRPCAKRPGTTLVVETTAPAQDPAPPPQENASADLHHLGSLIFGCARSTIRW